MTQPQQKSLDELRIHRHDGGGRGSRHGWRLVVLGILVLGAMAGGLLWKSRSGVVSVRTAVAREVSGGGRGTVLNASGYVVARREATVSSKVTGKVVEVFVQEGMKTEAGQLLARLDASNVTASLRLAEAQLQGAQAALRETEVLAEEAERELRRVSRLAASGITTEAELDRAESALNSLTARLASQRAEVVVAERQLAVWQQQLADTEIHAPFAGVVVSKNAQPGEMISPVSAGGGFTRTGICTIVDMNSLEIEVDVNESFINRVETGQPVEATLDAYPEWRIACRVIAIIPTADRQKATVKVRVGFDRLDPRLLPQMGVKVAFRAASDAQASHSSVLIPKAALREQNGRAAVFVVRNGFVERRAITLGEARDQEISVVSGLAAGEAVVIDPPPRLAPGNRVRLIKP